MVKYSVCEKENSTEIDVFEYLDFTKMKLEEFESKAMDMKQKVASMKTMFISKCSNTNNFRDLKSVTVDKNKENDKNNMKEQPPIVNANNSESCLELWRGKDVGTGYQSSECDDDACHSTRETKTHQTAFQNCEMPVSQGLHSETATPVQDRLSACTTKLNSPKKQQTSQRRITNRKMFDKQETQPLCSGDTESSRSSRVPPPPPAPSGDNHTDVSRMEKLASGNMLWKECKSLLRAAAKSAAAPRHYQPHSSSSNRKPAEDKSCKKMASNKGRAGSISKMSAHSDVTHENCPMWSTPDEPRPHDVPPADAEIRKNIPPPLLGTADRKRVLSTARALGSPSGWSEPGTPAPCDEVGDHGEGLTEVYCEISSLLDAYEQAQNGEQPITGLQHMLREKLQDVNILGSLQDTKDTLLELMRFTSSSSVQH